ncbi:MAG: ABC transporter permease [Prevotellaceae bacterium]|jgi:putative ABC transport system permease protein|nr:ABC transporter permease [Prevotellaceae bacterium]
MDFWQNVWTTIARNKWRSFFTAFGVFWGIFMLVVLLGFGLGIKATINHQVGHISANSCFFFTTQTNEAYKGFNKGRYWNLSINDLEAVKKNFPRLKYVSGVVFGMWGQQNNVSRADKQGSFQIIGLAPEYNKINPSKILEGRFINEIDIRERRKVCVIGKKVQNDLYEKDENAVGTVLHVSGIYYTVVGLIEPYSSNVNIFGNAEQMVVLPFSTLQIAANKGNSIDCIAITAPNNEDIKIYENSIKMMLKERNTISPTDSGGVDAFNMQMIFKPFMSLILGLQFLVWFVGLGTLFAGVVGVSNIMLITVRERTQEIGVLRALGATPRKIITQIMCESIVLTAFAGIFGILLGVGLLSFLEPILIQTKILSELQISFSAAISALLILIVCGLFAGLLPSSRAMKIKAVDALRDE